jgi:hypothetical protein
MAKLEVHQFPARSDNYGVLVHDPDTGATASIDAPDADAVLAALEKRLDAYPYPHHPSPRRPHRRQQASEGRDRLHHRRPEG